jgi:hypothetical protein
VWRHQLSNQDRFLTSCRYSGSTATIIRSTVLVSLSLIMLGSARDVQLTMVLLKEGLRNGDDFLWATADCAIWSTVEPGIGIAAASIATLRPLVQLVRWKVGLSDKRPSNAAWNDRNRTGGRSRSGYIQQSGTSSSIPIQNLSSNRGQFQTSIVSGEQTGATRHYAIEAKQKRETEGVRLGASVVATTEVSITNSESLKTDEYHVQKWGTPWKDQDGWN